MTIEPLNLIVRLGIIVLNLVPFILRRPRLLLLTSVVSLLLILSLIFLR